MKLNPKHYFAAFILLCSFYSCSTLKPLAPVATEADIPALVQPVSNVEVPVTVDLKTYFVQAENSVPNKFSGSQQPCEGLSYAYTFTRTPFAITGNNNVVNLKFTGSYGFSASYCAKCTTLLGSGPQCIVPTVSAQCGVGDEPPRRMEISYQSTINVTPDFHLQSKTILFPAPKPIDRCNIFMGNIDVTDRLIKYISGPLNDLGKQVDAKIAAYNIKPMIDQIWNNIATETKVGDVGYVSVNPLSVRLSSFSLNGSLLTFSVGLSAKPVVTTVSSPPPPKQVPNLTTYVPAKGFNVYLDLLENYDHLSKMINQQIDGMNAEVAGNQFIVDDTKVCGIGKQIAMQVNFKGTNTGTIYLVGTPVYNQVTHEISFPDLSFDLQTKAWMLKVAKWMFNGKIADMLRQRATYNLGKFIGDSKTRIQSELSRDLGNGIRSEVTIHDLDIQAIYPTSEKLIIRTLSNGQLKVKVVM
ncbi:MAG TPA: hypothetical protein DCO83_06645 [Mucilaginibacter sp.]|jgi:hypothetical protein|nr:hypothetical protein [Mucilaginibacter sp.]